MQTVTYLVTQVPVGEYILYVFNILNIMFMYAYKIARIVSDDIVQ